MNVAAPGVQSRITTFPPLANAAVGARYFLVIGQGRGTRR
jgi:hypothetical protein